MKFKILIVLIMIAVCVNAQQIGVPVSNQTSGIYTTDITVNLSHTDPGVTIFYTLNGNVPGPGDFIYSGPIVLSTRNGEANNHSMIKTNPSFDYPMGTYDATRANNRGWLPPVGEVYKINVLRFRAFKPGYVPSETVTQTFMIDPMGANKYSLPILSIVVDSIDLFSNESGYYVYGNHPQGNYNQKGVAWEKIAHFELFSDEGDLALTMKVRSRIHGGGSRTSCKKSLRIYADTDDNKNFIYPFFENYELKKFKRLIVRSGGHRPDCFPRDDLANMLTEGLPVDQQHNKHVILFMNGEYWGIYTIKERVDKYFIQNRHGIDDNLITILDQEYDVQDGYQIDSDIMQSLEDFVMAYDMSIPENYKFITDKVDVENYIDYMCSEIFLSNEDWVYSNVVIWRKTGGFFPDKPKPHDGKFRWVFYDFDGAFGGSCNQAYYTVNTLNAATVLTGTFSSYSRFFRGMLENPGFKRKFINRMCDLMNSQFRPNRMHEKIDEIFNKLTPEMLETVQRWRYPSTATTLFTRSTEVPSLTQWNLSLYNLHFFSDRRQRKIRDHIMAKWGYPDSSLVVVDVNNPLMGMVQVNSILINENLPGVNTASVYPWSGYYINTVALPLIAVPHPGYRFVEWLETGITTDTILWNPLGNASFTAVFEVDDNYQPIVINEVMPSNSSFIYDNFNDADDWLELFNPNPYAVNISGCKFQRDGLSWTIPNGTVINANGYLLYWKDAETYQGENHTSFKLPNSFTTLYFISGNNEIIDFIQYPTTSTNFSFGRYPNGSGSFTVFSQPTPLQNNNTTSIQENSKHTKLVAYPIPSSQWVNFNKPITYELFDLAGNRISSGINTNTIDVSSITNGIYIVVTSDKEIVKISVSK